MSLLDDLKNQSASIKTKEEQEKRRLAALEKYYQEKLHPKMLQVYSFLNELVEHLNFIQSATVAYYPILPKGELQSFQQKNYKVFIDSSKCVKNITFKFSCDLDSTIKFEMENDKNILRYSEVLDSYHMEYLRNDYKNDAYELISAIFKLKGPIPVSIIFQGDVEDSSIILMLSNFEKPGSVKHVVKERHITDKFLDGLGKYILRENKNFFSLDINEENKEKIRQNIQHDIKRRKQELEESERILQETEAREKEKKSWKNLFKKID